MALSDTQWEFLQDMAKLVMWADAHGYKLTGGELWRPPELEKIYVEDGRSKTMDSQHLKRLAIDLNLFVKNQYVGALSPEEQVKAYQPLGVYWESLNPKNVSGAVSWGWDPDHFERQL